MKKIEGPNKSRDHGVRRASSLITVPRSHGNSSSSINFDLTFAALADPIRRSILERLSNGDAYPKELAKPFNVSLPAISKHLRVLEKAGLIVRQREGQYLRCHFIASPMMDAATWIDSCRRHWEEHLDALTEYLASTKEE
ncbi:MAG: ArsR/SmtB family transcription factor [Nitrososphaerales archaeon]